MERDQPSNRAAAAGWQRDSDHFRASDDANVAACPQCGEPMHAVRGSRRAVCANCGFKDSCCY